MLKTTNTIGPGPFALSGPGVVESVLRAAGLQPTDRGEFSMVLDSPTAEAACRAMMGAVGARNPAQRGRTRSASHPGCATRIPGGDRRLPNQERFQFVIAA